MIERLVVALVLGFGIVILTYGVGSLITEIVYLSKYLKRGEKGC